LLFLFFSPCYTGFPHKVCHTSGCCSVVCFN